MRGRSKMHGPEITPLAHETMCSMEPASIAELLSSPMFAMFDGTILITGFAGEEDLLNSHEATGVLSAIDSASALLRLLFNTSEVSQMFCLDGDLPNPAPRIRLQWRESLLDLEDNLIFSSPEFRLPMVWIHRGHGGYDEDGQIGISAGLEADPMIPTHQVSDAIRSCRGAILLAVLPVCTSAPSADILRRNRRIVMAEGNDDTVISETQSEDRMRSLDQLRGLMRTRGWFPQVLQNLAVKLTGSESDE